MRKILALAAAFTIASAGVALADAPMTAALQAPLDKPTQIIAGGAVWRCEASACSAAAGGERAASVSACHELGEEVGPMAAYGPQGQPFGARELTRCNVGLKPAVTQTAAVSH